MLLSKKKMPKRVCFTELLSADTGINEIQLKEVLKCKIGSNFFNNEVEVGITARKNPLLIHFQHHL